MRICVPSCGSRVDFIALLQFNFHAFEWTFTSI